MAELILGIDIGSSAVKSILLDADKGIVASVSHSVELFSDQPGWAEADTKEWWKALCLAVPELLTKVNAKASQIKAIGISGMVPAVVITDSNNNPLRRAMLQNDARATNEIDELQNRVKDLDLLKLTGSKLTQQSVAPTAMWLANNEADNWKKVVNIFGSYDWLATELGADPYVEKNWAIESGLYGWDQRPIERVITATQVNWPKLLPVRNPGEIIGKVGAVAASKTGLLEGMPIVVGGADHVMSAYGAGLINNGDCLIKLGGSGDILAVSDEIFFDGRLYLDAHPIDGKWLPNGCMATSGSILRWEQKLFNGVDLTTLDLEANNTKPAALISLPYFLGEKSPLHDPNLRGAIAGLHLGSSRGDIHRCILEAIAYGFRQHFAIFVENGLSLNVPRVTNGGSKSKLWRTILSDVLNKDLVSIINHPGAAYGAAIAAGIGIGIIADWSFVSGSLEEGEIISPNPKNVEIYNESYQLFIEMQEYLTPISHQITRIKNQLK